MTDCAVSGDMASNGGVVAGNSNPYTLAVEFTRCNLIGNTATGWGGVLAIDGYDHVW